MLNEANMVKIARLLKYKSNARVTLTEIYQVLQINKNNFTSLYGCKINFLCSYSCQKIRSYLYERGIDEALIPIMIRFLERLHRDKDEFIAVFFNVKRENRYLLACFLVTELFLFLRNYAYRRDGLNYQKMWYMAGSIYSICFSWINDGCKEPNEVVLEMIKLVLAPLASYRIKNNQI